MAGLIDVKVPDIGDYKDVEVVEVLVKPGDTVAKEQSLISLESDKATMEIPAPEAGVVKEMVIKLGDKVSQGALILRMEGGEGSKAQPEKPQPSKPQAAATEAPDRRRIPASTATCSCWVPDPAATRPRSVPRISA